MGGGGFRLGSGFSLLDDAVRVIVCDGKRNTLEIFVKIPDDCDVTKRNHKLYYDMNLVPEAT